MADRALQEQQQILRLPLYAHEDQRQSSVTGAVASWGLNDQFLINCYPVVGKDPLQGDKPSVKLQSRMGWTGANATVNSVVANPTTAVVKAVLNMTQLSDQIVVVYVDGTDFNVVVYRPNAGTNTSLAVIPMGASYTREDYVHLSELEIGGVPYLGMVLSSATGTASSGYYCSSLGGLLSAGSWNTISDADYPPNATYTRKAVGPLVQMNAVIYQMTDEGWIHGSSPDINGLSRIDVWHADGLIQAVTYPDKGVTLARYKHHLVAFGEETIEFFNDEGIEPDALPIARTEQAFIKLGTINQKSAINIDDTLWFIGKSYTGLVSLYQLDGYTPKEIGSAFFRRLVSDRVYNIDLQVTTMHGMRHIVTNTRGEGRIWMDDNVLVGDSLDAPTAENIFLSCNLCYCIDTNTWWGWASEHNFWDAYGFEKLYFTTMYTGSSVVRYSWSVSFESVSSTFTYSIHPRAAWTYFEATGANVGHDSYRLNNSSEINHFRIPVMICTGMYDFDNENRKFLRQVRIVGDAVRNIDSASEPWATFNSEGLTLALGVTRDDTVDNYEQFEIFRTKNLLTYSEHNYRFHNFGALRRCRFMIQINTYVPLRFEALELVIAQGTH